MLPPLLLLLQATEDFIVHLFEDCNLCAIHAKRVTISKRPNTGAPVETLLSASLGVAVVWQRYTLSSFVSKWRVCTLCRTKIVRSGDSPVSTWSASL